MQHQRHQSVDAGAAGPVYAAFASGGQPAFLQPQPYVGRAPFNHAMNALTGTPPLARAMNMQQAAVDHGRNLHFSAAAAPLYPQGMDLAHVFPRPPMAGSQLGPAHSISAATAMGMPGGYPVALQEPAVLHQMVPSTPTRQCRQGKWGLALLSPKTTMELKLNVIRREWYGNPTDDAGHHDAGRFIADSWARRRGSLIQSPVRAAAGGVGADDADAAQGVTVPGGEEDEPAEADRFAVQEKAGGPGPSAGFASEGNRGPDCRRWDANPEPGISRRDGRHGPANGRPCGSLANLAAADGRAFDAAGVIRVDAEHASLG
jgi:hypothetical protein